MPPNTATEIDVLGRGWSLFWESELRQVEDGVLWRNTYGDFIPFPDMPAATRRSALTSSAGSRIMRS
ncbi:hypothetical protein [Yersinia entomophaga]|uniref:hypothetical protein n=1 Tax=Yersinia entomophaga TaxID=935293 RepID=UPI000AD93E06|nr:hypothetical protein [Yersinia entomophaga]